uniref:Glycosyltransferase n=1 Tax=Fagus sylvatica TaxID=28930 RepID=A0A2N9EU53_FAGSY
MESKPHRQLHIFFFPFMAQGHILPTIDMAKLFASRGVKATLIMTPFNAALFSNTIEGIKNLGIEIGVLIIKFPSVEVGLPEGCENAQLTITPEMQHKLFRAAALLEQPLEQLLQEHRPDCLVADTFFPWATDIASKHGIPRLVFHGTGFFALCASRCVLSYEPHKKVSSDSELFTIPTLPHEIKMTKQQLPDFITGNVETEFTKLYKASKEVESKSYGVIVNSFYELEPAYVDHYRNVLGTKSWHIGPVSLCNINTADKHDCLKWLDSKKPNSIVYVCFGSVANFNDAQLFEIALGLEASGQEFIWVVRREKDDEGREEWLPEGYEKRMEGKGLIIRGWKECLLEVPMVTWPVSAEQFYNEKLVTQILKIGVGVGAQRWAKLLGDSVKSDAIEKAVTRIMVGEEAKEIRSRAKVLGAMARSAVEEGGSSYSDLNALIEELKTLG